MNRYLSQLSVALVAGGMTLGAYKLFFDEPTPPVVVNQPVQQMPVRPVSLGPAGQGDFVEAANQSLNAVVHITTSVEARYYSNPLHQFFFGTPQPQEGNRIQVQSGSGVIISADGYIVTNNHVINGAEGIKVTLNDGKEAEARVIGTDPTTDIALIKVDLNALPAIEFGNSDQIEVGEWVLAVGNPFNLTSTVTAGIVSAKGRAIDIINEQTAIESFIQTDAVVNPGNSGGALVNLKGQLIGINTAISTHTGTFEGYSFAVPANIVKKVTEDLLEFGVVQRAFLGVTIGDVTPKMADEMGLKTDRGVYIGSVVEGGAADKGGVKRGDVITQIDGMPVTKTSKLQEMVGRKRPGDKVAVVVNRDGKEEKLELVLRNIEGTTDNITKEYSSVLAQLGGEFESLTTHEKKALGLRYGVKVMDVQAGKLRKAGVPRGFIITKVNNTLVQAPQDIEKALKNLKPGDGVLLQGFLPNGRPDYFAFGY